MMSYLTIVKVGAIIKKVKNNAKAIKTWLGGVCWVPKACLNIDITITILVNDVIPNNIDGKIVKADINSNICNDREYVVPPLSLASTFKAGKPPKVSIANILFIKNNPDKRRKINNTKFIFLKRSIMCYSH